MQLSVFDTIYLLGSAQGFFIALLLYRRQVSNRPASYYLLTILLLVSTLLLAKLSFQSEWVLKYAEIILLPDVILFAIGPCIWLFTRHLLLLPVLDRRQWLLHASPAIFYLTVVCTILGQHLGQHWHFLSTEEVIFGFYLIEGAGIISLATYFLKSLRLLRNAQLQSLETTVVPAAARFLPVFFKFGLFLTAIWTCSFVFHVINFDPKYLAYQVFWLLLAAYVYWLAYRVLLGSEIFDLPQIDPAPAPVDESLVHQVQTFIEQHQPFLEPSLKLGDLANQLNIPRHELSRIINHGFGKTFFDLINTYRIRTFIELRKHSPESEKSILELAYEVGFNSKSAFNRAFRKIKGSSPSQFFKEHSSV